MLLTLQVVRDHPLGLQCIWDAQRPDSAATNGGSCPEGEPFFTTWKFRSDGASKRTIDFIWYEAVVVFLGPGRLLTQSARALCVQGL